MTQLEILKRTGVLIGLIASVIVFSTLFNRFIGNLPEREIARENFLFRSGMTIAEFGRENTLPLPVLMAAFDLRQEADSMRSLGSIGLSGEQITVKTRTAFAQYQEEHSKNPVRFTIHFIVSLIFLGIVWYLLRLGWITPKRRKILYVISIVIFGVGFSSNPSPMGPVRDTIALFGDIGEALHPRLFAILTFLCLVVAANKFICAWACQFGVLQDFIFRLNRNREDNYGVIHQYKIPFRIANSIRVIFFLAISLCSFLWGLNVLSRIDPFIIFNPAEATLIGLVIVGNILILSLFVYRPWCHLFCPFGLIGWIVERFSIYNIRVDPEACTDCGACTASCPTDVMEAILKRRKTVPDCFACGTCINECPTGAIALKNGKRERWKDGKKDR